MAFPRAKALEALRQNRGTQFDPRVVDIFLELAGREVEKGIDPVCGMPGDEKKSLSREGLMFTFCSDACREEFRSNPSKYTGMRKMEGNFLPGKKTSHGKESDLITEGGENL